MIARLGHVRSAMSMGVNGRYLVDGVRNMSVPCRCRGRILAAGKPVHGLPMWGFSVSPVLLAPTVGAWGLLRLGAQKRKRERQPRQGAGVGQGDEFRAAEHDWNVALLRVSVQASVI